MLAAIIGPVFTSANRNLDLADEDGSVNIANRKTACRYVTCHVQDHVTTMVTTVVYRLVFKA